MAWLDNANTVASLVLAIFGIGGYIFGISTYLRKKATPVQQSIPTPVTTPQISSAPRKPLSWLEWTELFVQGLLATADFVLTLTMKTLYHPEKEEPLTKLGYCAGVCLLGGLMAELILSMLLGFILAALGFNNSFNIATAVGIILLLMTFTFLYIYHVGLLVENRQQEQYEELPGQPSTSGKKQ